MEARGTALDRRGFTLVEVLAATLILSIALLAVLVASQASRETQQRAVYIAAGRSMAQSKIEELRAAPFDAIDARTAATSDPSLPPGSFVSVNVWRYPDNMEPNLRRVVVTVVWPEGRGKRSISYETLIARK